MARIETNYPGTVIFIFVIIVSIMWLTFTSLNTLKMANNKEEGGCCSTKDCGERWHDQAVWYLFLGLATLFTLTLALYIFSVVNKWAKSSSLMNTDFQKLGRMKIAKIAPIETPTLAPPLASMGFGGFF